MAEQPNQPIAQVPAFEQHEDHHRQHEAGGAQGADDRTEPRETVKPVTSSEVTTTGREGVPVGALDCPRSVLIPSIVS